VSADQGLGRAAPRIIVGRGARATEELLLADLEALLAATEADLDLLARPVVVVVPSRSLRLHLAARLVGRRGRAVAGVEIVTLHGLAAGIVGRCEGQRRAGTRLLPVLVSRFARRESALRELAASLEDGELPVVATVRDLLDAGFAPENAEAVGEHLEGDRDEAERERASALVRIASAVALVLEAGDLDLTSDLLRRATELLRADPERALPSRAVLIHGFADATGVATDLIEALLRQREAWVYLDQPPDPVEHSRPDLGIAFSERFLERLRGVATPEPTAASATAPSTPVMFRAPGAHAEVREVARRIRRLLDDDAPPERIGVVARDLGPYALPVQVHFPRLGIPFSALGAAGSVDATARRVRALADLLRRGNQAPADSWLSAAGDLGGFEVRLALHACGAARVRDVAALDPDAVLDTNGEFVLPVRRGLTELPGDAGEVAPMLDLALSLDCPTAIRYPKTNAETINRPIVPMELGKAEVLRWGRDGMIVACGSLLSNCVEAADHLAEEGLDIGLINARFVKPLDWQTILRAVSESPFVVTVEEGALMGGFGSAVLEAACDAALDTSRIRRLGVPDHFIEHGTRNELLADLGLDAEGIAETCRQMAKSNHIAVGREHLANRQHV